MFKDCAMVIICQTSIMEVELKQPMLDPGFSLNIISLLVLERVSVLHDRLRGRKLRHLVLSNYTYTLGFVNPNLIVEPMRAVHQFHDIDSPTTYHLLLG